MNARRSKLARKAARIEKSQAQRQFDHELGHARTVLNQYLAAANGAYTEELLKLAKRRDEVKATAFKAFDEQRTKLVLKYAAEEETELKAAA